MTYPPIFKKASRLNPLWLKYTLTRLPDPHPIREQIILNGKTLTNDLGFDAFVFVYVTLD